MAEAPNDRGARVSSYYTGASGNQYAGWQITYAKATSHVIARRLQKYVAPDAVVLDFGCGGGEILSRLRCVRRIGVEPNPTALQFAARNGVEPHESTETVTSGIADVIICHHVLEHCKRPLDELREMARILKSSGKLVLVVPINDWRNDREYRADEVSHHLYTWTPLTLGHLLSEAGLELQAVAIKSDAKPPRRFSSLWQRWPEPLFERICDALGVLLRNRQIVAICRKPDVTSGDSALSHP